MTDSGPIPTPIPPRRSSRLRRWLRRGAFTAAVIVGALLLAGAYGWFIDPGLLVRTLRAGIYLRLGVEPRSVVVEGHDWPYLEAGPRDGRPMIFLHGYGTSKDAMMQMAAHFGAEGWRCIAPDLPGFGAHPFHEGQVHDAAFYTRSLAAFMDAVGMQHATVVGTSMGGALAAEFGLEFPGRTDALLLLSPAGVRAPIQNAFMQRVARGENPLDIARAEDFDAITKLVFLRPPPVPSPYRRCFVEQALERRAQTLQIVESMRPFLSEGLQGRLGALRAPTLVLYGDQDAVTDPSMLQVFEAEIPGVRTWIVEDAGHVAFSDNWPGTRRAMEDFLESLQRTTSGG